MRQLDIIKTLLIKILPTLTWRRHGVGMIQGYVSEGGYVEERVHIWDPSCIREGIEDRGDIHNHRFDFWSTVIVGKVSNRRIFPLADLNGTHRVYSCTNARKGMGDPLEPELFEGCSRVRLVRYVPEWIGPGGSYFFERGSFHRSTSDGFAITYVQKFDQVDTKALIIANAEEPVVHAMSDDDGFDTDQLVRKAIDILSNGR